MSAANRPSAEVIELEIRGTIPVASFDSVLLRASVASSINPVVPELVRNESILAPVDGGFGAWSFLAAAFLVETIVWGFPSAFGVFLAEYLKNPVYLSQPGATSLLPLIGSLSTGIIYCSGVVIYPFTSRYPQWRRTLILVGGFICFASLFGASYATTVNQLVALQGVLYAIGGSLLYAPCLCYVSEWFVKKQGLANGVLSAGTAVGGLILPFIIPRLVAVHGASTALRYLSIAIGISLIPCYPFLKGRLPVARVQGPAARGAPDRAWLTSAPFWLLAAVSTMQGFGYFVPILWLPTFASNLDISDSNSSLTLAVLNGASAVGRVVMGYASDNIDPWLLILSTLGTSALATFILWGVLSNSFAGLLAFGLVYGVMAGGFTSLWPAIVRPIAKDDVALITSLYGYLLLTRGIGNIASTPVSNALLRTNQSVSIPYHHTKTGFAVGEGRYENVIIYVGICFAAASVISVGGWAMEKSRAQRDRVRE
ncbi:MFS general substrate transporter [Athelia psychrophila]|uniref:MFS general substrate transporter n=1 Tax=Athelia psychrophila TaxID=1759441 RepID=A0A166W4U5_9AGAM|nr:MFS general substrate transporter [Fibularhizoctonia sp. CBS 109695]